MQKNIIIVLAIVVLLVVGGGSFYWGMSYGKTQSASSATALRASFAGRTGRTGTTGGGFVSGSIISSDATSITLQLPNNAGSKIVLYSSTTQINKMVSGSASDLTNGTNVSITGTTNSDGSVTAQSIQIRPAMPAQQNNPAQ